jgi:flagellar basal body-associated protein FliL
MKIEPILPPEPEPLKKDRGCAFAVIILVFLVLLAAAGGWILIWSGGHRDADKEVNKSVPAERP